MVVRLFLATSVLMALAPLVSGLAAAPPRPGGLMLVVVPPWLMAEQVIVQAGGQPVGPVAAPMAMFATAGAADFATRARQSGAIAVRDATLLAPLCGVSS